jgi:hypothetical protein
MGTVRVNTCPECGAPSRDGRSCREQFDALMALEYNDPEGLGAVHHLTVLCYVLQHPSRYSMPAVIWGKAALKAAVQHSVPPRELRRQAGRLFGGSARVRGVLPIAGLHRTQWKMTIADVYGCDPGEYTNRVEAWARSIAGQIEASRKI